jgi:hypothetical protein
MRLMQLLSHVVINDHVIRKSHDVMLDSQLIRLNEREREIEERERRERIESDVYE